MANVILLKGGQVETAFDLDDRLHLIDRDMGYDTLIMGIRDARAIRSALGIPENEEIMSVIAVGRRDGDPKALSRKPLDEVARFY